MKNRKIFSRFLVPTLVVAIFGLTAVSNVWAQTFKTPETQTSISNVVPVISVAVSDNSSFCPSPEREIRVSKRGRADKIKLPRIKPINK